MLWMGGEPLLRRRLLATARALSSQHHHHQRTVPLVDFGPHVLYVVSLDGPED